METLIILSNMKKTIEVLLKKLEEKHIVKHVLCPSACSVFSELDKLIEKPIKIIDERSAGYVATGMCEEICAPVVVWCADNDSYRNLTSALTEAYYRKLPILVVALACDSRINQAINPLDIIRYYANNTIVGSRGTVADIEKAIDHLYADVKGPVYLSLSTFSEEISIDNHTNAYDPSIDITTIASILPSDACVHIGSYFDCSNEFLNNASQRSNHSSKDGNLSMLIGSSVVAPEQLHIGIFSSDEIAYDLNMFGNRHVGNNLIVLCIKQNERYSSAFDFAHRMQWECKKIKFTDLDALRDALFLSDKPKYIEVTL